MENSTENCKIKAMIHDCEVYSNEKDVFLLNTTCVWLAHQPKLPQGADKLKKHQ